LEAEERGGEKGEGRSVEEEEEELKEDRKT
jgi:hypothetical protein